MLQIAVQYRCYVVAPPCRILFVKDELRYCKTTVYLQLCHLHLTDVHYLAVVISYCYYHHDHAILTGIILMFLDSKICLMLRHHCDFHLQQDCQFCTALTARLTAVVDYIHHCTID